MTKPSTITEDHLDLMHRIQNNSNESQRKIAQEIVLSIGKVNYCLQALLAIGFIKVHRFNKSAQKFYYVNILTPRGIREKNSLNKEIYYQKETRIR